MFGSDGTPCKLLPFKLQTVNANHDAVQNVIIRLQTEFTDDVCADIGDGAKDAKEAMVSGAMRKAEFKLSAVAANINLHCGEYHPELKKFRGVTAVASITEAKGEEEPTPLVVLSFEGPWTDDMLLALAHACNMNGTMSVERIQLSLLDPPPKTEEPKAPEPEQKDLL